MIQTKIDVPQIKKTATIKRVAFFGSADVDEKTPLFQEAFVAASRLAREGRVIVNGGGPGVMLAATQGAESVGGKTVAVTFYPKDMPEFEGRLNENQVDKEIKTANYIERMFGLIKEADIFICFRGGTGTLSEWSTAWLLAHLYYGHHKPLILYGDFWHEFMRITNEIFLIGEKEQTLYKIVKNEEEMIAAIDEFEKELADRHLLPNKES